MENYKDVKFDSSDAEHSDSEYYDAYSQAYCSADLLRSLAESSLPPSAAAKSSKMDEDKLSKRIEQQIKKLYSVDDICCERFRGHNVSYLVANMQQIQFKVECAEKQKEETFTNTPKVKIWLEKVKCTIDEVDHLLDESSKEELRPYDKKNKKVHIIFSSLRQLAFDFKMANKIKELTKRMKSLQKFTDFTG